MRRLSPSIRFFDLLAMERTESSCTVFISYCSHLTCHRSALDKVSSNKVAIKKVTRAFDDPIDAKRILREIKLLKRFDHDNVVRNIYVVSSIMDYRRL